MCTVGRFRLFWGVSPDLMAIALPLSTAGIFISCLYFMYSIKHKQLIKILRAFRFLNLLIYI